MRDFAGYYQPPHLTAPSRLRVEDGLRVAIAREAAQGVDAALDVVPPQRFIPVTVSSEADRAVIDCRLDPFFRQRCGRFARPRLRLSLQPGIATRPDLGRTLRVGVESALRARRLRDRPETRLSAEAFPRWIDRRGGLGAALPELFLHGDWSSDRLLLLLAISTERHGCRRCAEFVGDMAETIVLRDRAARRRLMMAMARKVPMIEMRLAQMALASLGREADDADRLH